MTFASGEPLEFVTIHNNCGEKTFCHKHNIWSLTLELVKTTYWKNNSDYIIFVKNNELNADEIERGTTTSLQRQTGSGLGSSSRTLDRNESEKKCKINIYGYYNIGGICLPVRWLYTRVIRINFPTQVPVYYVPI